MDPKLLLYHMNWWCTVMTLNAPVHEIYYGCLAFRVQNRNQSSFNTYCIYPYILYLSLHTVFILTYRIYPCISRPPIFEPKNQFFLFLGKNFPEKLIFYLRIFFQVQYAMVTQKICPDLFLISVFDSCISQDWFLRCKRWTYTGLKTVWYITSHVEQKNVS